MANPRSPKSVSLRSVLPRMEPPGPKDLDGEDDRSRQPRRQKARIKLGDGKERSTST
jgi:hypothetical protein